MTRLSLLFLGLICLFPVAALTDSSDFLVWLGEVEQERNSDPAATLERLNLLLGDAEPAPAADHEQLIAQATLYRIRTELLREQGAFEAAAVEAARFAALATISDDTVLTARAIFLRGTIQAEKGHFGEALDYFHQARRILEGSADFGERAMVYNAIGMTHNFAGDSERARSYFERALELARRSGQDFRVATYLSNLASSVADLDGPEQAISMQEEVLALGEAMAEPMLIAQASVNLCNVLVSAEVLERAATVCPEALAMADGVESLRWRAGVRYALGNLSAAQDDLEQASLWYEEALGLAREGVPILQRELLWRMAQLHLKRGATEEAGERFQELLDFNAMALERERQALGEELEIRYQLERTQAELELLQLSRELQDAQLRLRNGLLVAMVIVLGLTLLTMVVSYRGNRIRSSLQSDLARRNAELQDALSQISHLAQTDPLTGLLNRRALRQVAQQELARARRERWPISVLLCDIDHFKRINDQHGHALGDELLVGLAARLKQNFREADLVARWGGEEFLCVLPKATPPEAKEAIDRLTADLANNPITTANGPLPITLTWGVATFREDLDAAIDLADQRMYLGKRGGRNQTVVRGAAENGGHEQD